MPLLGRLGHLYLAVGLPGDLRAVEGARAAAGDGWRTAEVAMSRAQADPPCFINALNALSSLVASAQL